MATSLSFAHQLGYGVPNPATGQRSGVGTRPYALFAVVNTQTGARSNLEFALIDSGCDECLLRPGIETSIGLALGNPVAIAGIGGGATAHELPGAEIEIEGVLFQPKRLLIGATTGSIVGRQIYLRAFHLAFTNTDWYHS